MTTLNEFRNQLKKENMDFVAKYAKPIVEGTPLLPDGNIDVPNILTKLRAEVGSSVFDRMLERAIMQAVMELSTGSDPK